MSTSIQIQAVLNGTINALKSVIPYDIQVSPPTITSDPYEQNEIGVLIGMVGDLKGRIIIDSTPDTFSAIGAGMYGMTLEGAMLESFTGEFGNMIAGNLCTFAAEKELDLDITPPNCNGRAYKIIRFPTCF